MSSSEQTMKSRRQYGLWPSPVTPLSLARSMSFSDVAWAEDGSLVWLEGRSDRGVLVVQSSDGQAIRDLNSEFSIRARLGYGGGSFTVDRGQVYFVEAQSGRLYRQPLEGGQAFPITPAFGKAAAPQLSPDGNWVLFVHSYESQDCLAIVDSSGTSWPRKLASGDDFFMQPAWHPDGTRLAWIAWNHPNMPWNGTYLRLGRLNLDGNLPVLEGIDTVAGDETTSIFQPEFSPDGRYLVYVSDASGWWQLYLYDLTSHQHRQLTSNPSEHGLPAWIQGMRTYAFHPHEPRLFFLRSQDGIVSLWQYDFDSGVEERLLSGDSYTDLSQICASPYGLALLASGDRVPPRVISYAFPGARETGWKQAGVVQVIRRSSSEELPEKAYSTSQAIQWPGKDGGNVHGLFYAPNHPDYKGQGKPPLVVLVHGGPTGQATAAFNQRAQFFTSRGYAVLEVNFRGSAGYGREYRDKLRGNWGVYDVEDAVSGARDLAESGLVDGGRMAIMGSSSGGFTVLKALEDYPGVFKVGICMYGISNHFTLVEEIHKFEAHYSDALLGPLPEAAEVYRQRSPIFFADRIRDALALFQGENDVVVPREQSDELAKVLRQLGVPHVYRVYPGEGHGFRKAETMEDLYSTIESFLRQYLIFA